MISQIHCIPTTSPGQTTHHRSGSVTSQLSSKIQSFRLGLGSSQSQNLDRTDHINPSTMEHSNGAVLTSEWPKSLEGDLVWSGAGTAGATRAVPHIIALQPTDVEDIEAALESFKGKELHGDQVSRETFRLSQSLEDRLKDAAIAVHNKQGFCQIRGLDAGKYSPENNALIYLGVASYIGNVRGVQDSAGSMLSHITVAKQWEDIPEKLRHGVHTNHSMPFHNDMGTDVLALQYRQCAKEGGHTFVTSGWTLYNELAANHPDVLKTLATPDWPIQITKRRARHIMAPLIQYQDGKVMISLDPGRLGRQMANKEHVSSKDKAKMVRSEMSSSASVPSLTREQLDALETLNELAHKHKVAIVAQPGDMVFINNWALLHARDKYTDDAADFSRRHLVRIWLHNEELAWKVPGALKTPWAAAFGYHFTDSVDPANAHPRTMVNRKYPVVPAVDYNVPKYTAGSAAFVIDSSDEEDFNDDHVAVDGDFLAGESAESTN